MLELLRPPPHRGPLIAAGAVVLAAGLALTEIRVGGNVVAGVALLLLGVPAALILSLGLQAPSEDGGPPAYQSALLVAGLLLLAFALQRLADTLGADTDGSLPSGVVTWTMLVETAVAAYAAVTRRSAICALIAAIAFGAALLAAIDWIFDPDGFTAARWLLLVLATALVLGSLALRASRPRHAELLIVAAGLAILTIGLQALTSALFGTLLDDEPATLLPGFWELVLVSVAFGLMAYGAVDRKPGPAWMGVANLVAFLVVAGTPGDRTMYWWPLLLIVIGGAAMIAGLRPRAPLPPEPAGYRAGEQPLAARASDSDELVLRVRDDSPPAGGVPDR